ncbi:hypothetical protein [Lysobacter hankyongensis]|uniref:hypothetical protein n=1 Tax=Lysobacter hankyongensis TaxID=1176535 RepID=UPI0031E4FD1D
MRAQASTQPTVLQGDPPAERVVSRHHVEQEAPPLHAALDYRARRLCVALDARADSGADAALLVRLGPASAQLLRWWCSHAACRMRVDNFSVVQRQALLHVLLAHEVLRSDDPGVLYRRACDPSTLGDATDIPDAAHHGLRLAPGSGLRWVLQALLVWRWANAFDAIQTQVDADTMPTLRLRVIAATPALRRRLQAAILGTACDPATAGRDAPHGIEGSSLLRHARLFVPPALRAPFRAWLLAQARGAGGLRIVDAAPQDPRTVWTLIEARTTEKCTIEQNPPAADDTTTRPRLRIDLQLAADINAHAHGDAALIDVPLAQAIRRSACKMPALETVDTARLPLPAKPPRRPGLRPRLSRAHRRLLAAGLAALRQREDAFAALDAARRPHLLVLCATPLLMRAARRWLIDAGLDDDAIAFADEARTDDPSAATRARIAGPQTPLCDAGICVVAILRSHRDDATQRLAAFAAVSGAPLLWPEPDFVDLRSDNVERAALRRPPRHLIDVLSIVDDPRCRDAHASLPHLLDTTAVPATDDLFATPLRADAATFDIAMPAPCDGAAHMPQAILPERLSDLPRRILRARHALPVAKSVYAHAPCSALDSGLRRALLECAEADPAIDSHCLLDPRRHGTRFREAWLAHAPRASAPDPRGWPDALVRTADRIYLVELQPFCPTGPQPPGPAERALLRWLRQLDARPPDQRGHRRWFRAAVPAPLFWSWKRSGGALSALLSMLADTAAHPPQRED